LEGRQLVLRHLPGVHEHPDVILLDERPLEVAMGTLRGVGLTDREVAVVRLLGGGASNGEIARQLSLSTWTVKRHLANIYAKLGVSSRVRVAALALEIEAHHDRPPASRRSG
jgi:DNA-binding CsgD family transcriptional regulator